MVVDANLLVVIFSGDERGERVLEQFFVWLDQQISLDAPQLSQYEAINALTRLAVVGRIDIKTAKKAAIDVLSLPVNYHPVRRPDRTRNCGAT